MISSTVKNYVSALVMGGALLVGGMMLSRASFAQEKGAKAQTMEGVVSDAMCGAKHKMADAAKCTMGCASKGGGLALVVGEKVYTLDGKTEGLEKMGGAKAKITGTVAGDKITVQSYEAAG